MKIRKLTLLLIFSLVFFTNCNNDDDSNITETLNGVWDLKNISGGLPGVDVDYENGIVTWNFDSETETLNVTSSLINNGPQSVYLPLQTGSYSYSLSESDEKTFVHIENFGIHTNGEYGSYIINNGILTIDQREGSDSSANDVFILLFNNN